MTKANTIAIPVGFNPADPASVAAAFALLSTDGTDAFAVTQGNVNLVGPTLTADILSVASGPLVLVTDFEYALVLPAETFSLATGGVVEVIDVTPVPSAEIVVQGLAPAVGVGVRVLAPAAQIVVQGLAPAVGVGVRVLVPAAQVGVSVQMPEISSGPIDLVVPNLTILTAALAPTVVTGQPLTLGSVVSIAALAPTVVTGQPLTLGSVVSIAALAPTVNP